MSFEHASAYASWAGKRLPTEAEYEYAAHGGPGHARFAWGDEAYPDGVPQANSWLGGFPYENRGPWKGSTSPVGSYPANGYGLFDMIGNVWEWTSEVYRPRHLVPGQNPVDPQNRANLLSNAGAEPEPATPRHVLKGGSHLCSPDYCLRFRPAARSPQTDDSAATHIGFRCARS